MLFDERCRPLQDASALRGPHAAPNLQRRSRRGDGQIDIGPAGLGHFGNRLLRGGIKIDGILAAARSNVPAVDEQFVVG